MRNSFVACLILSGLACAQAEERTSRSYAACLDKTGGVTSAMQDCIREELERQDRRLNGAYQALMGSVPEKRRAQLRDAQRKWIAFRDANCEFYYDPQGGSAARLASNECVVTLTAQRAHELETLKGK
ncbi:MAG TPA: lysozyme inhibitor LprI family protein [Xanthobacteraceae bacterium]